MSRRNQILMEVAGAIKPSSFHDYRDYLASLFRAMKERCAPYSYLSFAEDLGFAPSNMIRLAITGKRDLASRTARTIAKALGLGSEDRRYFLSLVGYQSTRSSDVRGRKLEQLFDIKKHSAISPGSEESASYFEHWYHPVVREFLRLHGHVVGPEEVASKIFPRITVEQARSSLTLLVALGQARFDAVKGIFVTDGPDQLSVPNDSILNHFIALKYHKEMLEVASEAVDELAEDKRELNAMTLSLSTESMELLRYRLRDFCRAAIELDQRSTDKRHVVQLNLQMLALASIDEADIQLSKRKPKLGKKETGS